MSAADIQEIRKTAEIIEKIAKDEKAFKEMVDAHDNENAEVFQAVLGKLGVLEHCERICFWICFKKCVLRCQFLCPVDQPNLKVIEIEEMRKFSLEVMRLVNDPQSLNMLLEAYDKRDVKAFQDILKKVQLLPYCKQVCSWFCHIRCKRVCIGRLCPAPPVIELVGDLLTDDFTVPEGFAKGPSDTPGLTPADNPAGGVGDHPFGGSINIRGLFNVTNPEYYKVEYSTDPTDPTSWIPITTPNRDRYLSIACGGWFCNYSRSAVNLGTDGNGWYKIPYDAGSSPPGTSTGMSLDMGPPADLTDWVTRDSSGTILVPDGEYYLKLTVKKGASKFSSPSVKLHIDNTNPTVDQFELFQKGKNLGCCGEIKRDGGPIEIRFKAWDDNFGIYTLSIQGSCTFFVPIFSRSYNGVTTDKGETATKIVTWDPSVIKEEGCCCYNVVLRIWDRAVVDNQFSLRHRTEPPPKFLRIC